MRRPPARLAWTPSRYARARQGNLSGGERPICPSSHADGGIAGQRRAATSPLRPRAQSPCAEIFLPLRRLDQGAIPLGRASAGHPPTCIGVFPFLGSPPQKEKGRGSGEREGGAGRGGRTRDAVGAPRPETAPVAARKEGEVVRVGGGAGPEQGPGCRCERLRRATVYPEPATTTPPTHHEHPVAIFFFPSSLDAS
jgi:hypothetical protein